MVHKITLVIFLILSVVTVNVNVAKHIEGNFYHCKGGPGHWGDWDRTCIGERQSPIDIPCSSCNARVKMEYPDFRRSLSYFEKPKTLKVIRTVNNVGLAPHFGKHKIKITGGPLEDVYVLDHIHFHWGSKEGIGSEHSINGKTFDMEVHAVHYNSKYSSMKKAEIEPDGLLIIAYLYRAKSNVKDPAMDCVTCCFRKFYRKCKSSKIPRPFPIALLLPPFQRSYVTYPGSLTTPPCYETVTWIVYDRVLDISLHNMEEFRELYCVDPALRNNYRPRQPVHNRPIIGRP